MCEIPEAKLKRVEDALVYAKNIIETVRDSLIVLDYDLKVVSANKSFYDSFKVDSKETIGQFIYNLGNKQWDIQGLRNLLSDILYTQSSVKDYEIEHTFEAIGRKSNASECQAH